MDISPGPSAAVTAETTGCRTSGRQRRKPKEFWRNEKTNKENVMQPLDFSEPESRRQRAGPGPLPIAPPGKMHPLSPSRRSESRLLSDSLAKFTPRGLGTADSDNDSPTTLQAAAVGGRKSGPGLRAHNIRGRLAAAAPQDDEVDAPDVSPFAYGGSPQQHPRRQQVQAAATPRKIPVSQLAAAAAEGPPPGRPPPPSRKTAAAHHAAEGHPAGRMPPPPAPSSRAGDDGAPRQGRGRPMKNKGLQQQQPVSDDAAPELAMGQARQLRAGAPLTAAAAASPAGAATAVGLAASAKAAAAHPTGAGGCGAAATPGEPARVVKRRTRLDPVLSSVIMVKDLAAAVPPSTYGTASGLRVGADSVLGSPSGRRGRRAGAHGAQSTLTLGGLKDEVGGGDARAGKDIAAGSSTVTAAGRAPKLAKAQLPPGKPPPVDAPPPRGNSGGRPVSASKKGTKGKTAVGGPDGGQATWEQQHSLPAAQGMPPLAVAQHQQADEEEAGRPKKRRRGGTGQASPLPEAQPIGTAAKKYEAGAHEEPVAGAGALAAAEKAVAAAAAEEPLEAAAGGAGDAAARDVPCSRKKSGLKSARKQEAQALGEIPAAAAQPAQQLKADGGLGDAAEGVDGSDMSSPSRPKPCSMMAGRNQLYGPHRGLSQQQQHEQQAQQWQGDSARGGSQQRQEGEGGGGRNKRRRGADPQDAAIAAAPAQGACHEGPSRQCCNEEAAAGGVREEGSPSASDSDDGAGAAHWGWQRMQPRQEQAASGRHQQPPQQERQPSAAGPERSARGGGLTILLDPHGAEPVSVPDPATNAAAPNDGPGIGAGQPAPAGLSAAATRVDVASEIGDEQRGAGGPRLSDDDAYVDDTATVAIGDPAAARRRAEHSPAGSVAQSNAPNVRLAGTAAAARERPLTALSAGAQRVRGAAPRLLEEDFGAMAHGGETASWSSGERLLREQHAAELAAVRARGGTADRQREPGGGDGEEQGPDGRGGRSQRGAAGDGVQHTAAAPIHGHKNPGGRAAAAPYTRGASSGDGSGSEESGGGGNVGEFHVMSRRELSRVQPHAHHHGAHEGGDAVHRPPPSAQESGGVARPAGPRRGGPRPPDQDADGSEGAAGAAAAPAAAAAAAGPGTSSAPLSGDFHMLRRPVGGHQYQAARAGEAAAGPADGRAYATDAAGRGTGHGAGTPEPGAFKEPAGAPPRGLGGEGQHQRRTGAGSFLRQFEVTADVFATDRFDAVVAAGDGGGNQAPVGPDAGTRRAAWPGEVGHVAAGQPQRPQEQQPMRHGMHDAPQREPCRRPWQPHMTPPPHEQDPPPWQRPAADRRAGLEAVRDEVAEERESSDLAAAGGGWGAQGADRAHRSWDAGVATRRNTGDQGWGVGAAGGSGGPGQQWRAPPEPKPRAQTGSSLYGPETYGCGRDAGRPPSAPFYGAAPFPGGSAAAAAVQPGYGYGSGTQGRPADNHQQLQQQQCRGARPASRDERSWDADHLDADWRQPTALGAACNGGGRDGERRARDDRWRGADRQQQILQRRSPGLVCGNDRYRTDEDPYGSAGGRRQGAPAADQYGQPPSPHTHQRSAWQQEVPAAPAAWAANGDADDGYDEMDVDGGNPGGQHVHPQQRRPRQQSLSPCDPAYQPTPGGQQGPMGEPVSADGCAGTGRDQRATHPAQRACAAGPAQHQESRRGPPYEPHPQQQQQPRQAQPQYPQARREPQYEPSLPQQQQQPQPQYQEARRGPPYEPSPPRQQQQPQPQYPEARRGAPHEPSPSQQQQPSPLQCPPFRGQQQQWPQDHSPQRRRSPSPPPPPRQPDVSEAPGQRAGGPHGWHSGAAWRDAAPQGDPVRQPPPMHPAPEAAQQYCHQQLHQQQNHHQHHHQEQQHYYQQQGRQQQQPAASHGAPPHPQVNNADLNRPAVGPAAPAPQPCRQPHFTVPVIRNQQQRAPSAGGPAAAHPGADRQTASAAPASAAAAGATTRVKPSAVIPDLGRFHAMLLAADAQQKRAKQRHLELAEREEDGWTLEEDQKLQKIVFSMDPNTPGFWSKVARELPGKSAAECHSRVYAAAEKCEDISQYKKMKRLLLSADTTARPPAKATFAAARKQQRMEREQAQRERLAQAGGVHLRREREGEEEEGDDDDYESEARRPGAAAWGGRRPHQQLRSVLPENPDAYRELMEDMKRQKAADKFTTSFLSRQGGWTRWQKAVKEASERARLRDVAAGSRPGASLGIRAWHRPAAPAAPAAPSRYDEEAMTGLIRKLIASNERRQERQQWRDDDELLGDTYDDDLYGDDPYDDQYDDDGPEVDEVLTTEEQGMMQFLLEEGLVTADGIPVDPRQ